MSRFVPAADIGQLASLARTALDDPDGLPQREWVKLNAARAGQTEDWAGERAYAVDRLDDIIRITDPEPDGVNPLSGVVDADEVRGLAALAEHLADWLNNEAEDTGAPLRAPDALQLADFLDNLYSSLV